MKTVQVKNKGGLDNLDVVELEDPTPRKGEVLVRWHATSLNFHDYLVANGAIPVADDQIPMSDGAGEVIAVGEGVSKWRAGDQVMSLFFPNWLDGPASYAATKSISGENFPGFATEMSCLNAESLTSMPKGYSYAEAATLPCAALTAWRALIVEGQLKTGDRVLVEGGWEITGTKLWTTYAHRNHYMIVLVRTEPPSENRHAGMSQFLVDMSNPGVQARPIKNIGGEEDFNEVVFDRAFVSDDDVIGELGNGWSQVTSELGYERSGSERFLSTFRVYIEFLRLFESSPPNDQQAITIGRITSSLMALRRMSLSVAGMLEDGKMPAVEASLVKELGNNFEKLMPEMARLAAPLDVDKSEFNQTYRESILLSPSTTLRGGTREILRGVIARGLGLR